MSTTTHRPNKILNTRRSQRLLLRMAVIVAGQRTNGTSFVEQSSTEVVNAHGALVLLRESVLNGQPLRIRNVKTGEEEACKVVSVGQLNDGKTEVAVEFLKPAPRFWRIAFPPDDWNVHSPEARRLAKKPGEANRESVPQTPTEKR